MASRIARSPQVTLFVATRKGLFVFRSGASRRNWALDGPHFLGHVLNHVVLDPRDGRTALAAAKTGHLGPTLYRSTDAGRNWTEAKQPPAFAKAEEGEEGRSVESVFWLAPGHAAEAGTWYAGTAPAGLFRTNDHGMTWQEVAGMNTDLYARIKEAVVAVPDGSMLHSILIDPRDARHLYISISTGGTFESTDAGASWQPLNRGIAAEFLPGPDAEFGHDPHCVALHPRAPDRLYQQNHCGIYRVDRPASEWQRIGDNMPKEVGDIGFPMVLHPRDPDCAWVFPMDGTAVWPRTSPGGKPAAYCTRDGGASWQRQDRGLPREHAWWTVKRQAMCADSSDRVGLYVGTTGGELWSSNDEGASWFHIASHLPQINAVTCGVEA